MDIFLINMMEDPEYPRVLSPLTKGPITQFVLEGKQVKTPDIPDVSCRIFWNFHSSR